MTTPVRHTGAIPPWGLALTAMLSVQLGSALSVHLISAVGPAGTAWLRLSMGALIFLALARPPLRSIRVGDLPALLGLGVTTGLQTIAFLCAIERIPLGTAVAVEFLGPLTIAAVRSRSVRALGTRGLSLTIPIAAATAAVLGIPQAAGHLTLSVLAAAAGLALLIPVLPYALEMFALRQLTPAAFGTLMALEPAIGVLLGLIVLHQRLSVSQLAGILLVVLAGAAAQRGGRRPPAIEETGTDPELVDAAH
jgi:inner membrane transporter RhtA